VGNGSDGLSLETAINKSVFDVHIHYAYACGGSCVARAFVAGLRSAVEPSE
jgi:hypothetical protein